MTAEELFHYSHEPYRTELIAGRLVEMEPEGALHGLVAGRIGALLTGHVLAARSGAVFAAGTGFQLAWDPDTVRAPDASFVSSERIEAMGGIPEGFILGPPDLAFEVTSQHDRRGEVESKTRSWLEAGTRAVVVINPIRRIAVVHRPDATTTEYGTADLLRLEDVLPGFAVPLADILA
jgi:Uma2 family endonuclease